MERGVSITSLVETLLDNLLVSGCGAQTLGIDFEISNRNAMVKGYSVPNF
jgi:hypothetical protein